MAMDTIRSTAHLQREIGEELFAALISSDNTVAVKQFAATLVKKPIEELTLGGRTYEILGFLKGNEKSVSGDVMVTRATEMSANLREEDCQHVLQHQSEIPVALRGKVVFVFINWRHPADSEGVACVFWDGSSWVQRWRWLDDGWYGDYRLLRRK